MIDTLPLGAEAAGGETGLILALTNDLFLVPRLEDVGRELGYRVEVVDRPEVLDASGPTAARTVPLTEPLSGADAGMVRRLTELHPVLLLVDLSADELPWERWIQTLKTSAATRRIPIVAFGPHVEVERLERARRAGADEVVTRGRLQKSLPDLIETWARAPDREALASACRGELSERARRGIELHARGEYFEAHEELEHAFMEAPEAEGYLYRSLLQVSVAYLHVRRENYRGAVKMLLRLRQWLDPLPNVCQGVDIVALRTQAEALWAALEESGEEGVREIDPALLRPFPMAGGSGPN